MLAKMYFNALLPYQPITAPSSKSECKISNSNSHLINVFFGSSIGGGGSSAFFAYYGTSAFFPYEGNYGTMLWHHTMVPRQWNQGLR